MEKIPRVSIGMPVRNGQHFIREALDSLLAQTFTDFEIIICDNASTDSTESICQEYASRDSRVRYFRNPRNLGPAGNHNRCFELASGEYFRWHAHDDTCTPDHLAKCVKILDEDPSVILVYPQTAVIDEHSVIRDTYDFVLDSDIASPARRFNQLISVRHRLHRNFEIFGLTRASALRQTPLEEAYAHGDRVLTVRLSLLGKFRYIREPLFLGRWHSAQSMQFLPTTSRLRQFLTRWLGPGPLPPPEWWDVTRKGKINFPDWNLLKVYLISIKQAPIGFVQKAQCYAIMVKWFIVNSPKLFRDIVFAVEHVLNRMFERPALSGSPAATK